MSKFFRVPPGLTLFDMGGMIAPKMFLTIVLKPLGGGS